MFATNETPPYASNGGPGSHASSQTESPTSLPPIVTLVLAVPGTK
jgi:hypothetical protein